MIIFIDFDGTLTHDGAYLGKGPSNFHAPNMPVMNFVKKLHEHGHKVVVWTCRGVDEYGDILGYCAKHGLTVDGINTNAFSPIPASSALNSPKYYADLYIDDRAISLWELEKLLDANYCNSGLLTLEGAMHVLDLKKRLFGGRSQ